MLNNLNNNNILNFDENINNIKYLIENKYKKISETLITDYLNKKQIDQN